jgi:DNA-binding FadR family transcriptional regulator
MIQTGRLPVTEQPLRPDAPQKQDNSATLASKVVSYLRDLIATQGLRPGARLPSETSISTTLGVSRPIVREALRTLAATGLIEMAVGKRATVSALGGGVLQSIIENAVMIGQADIGHVMEMRRGIEIGMVALAAERRSDETAALLTDIVKQMAGKIDSVQEYTALDMQLHLKLAEAADNPLYLMLVEACRQIFETSMMIGIEQWSATPELSRVQQLHEAIVAAVVACNPKAASRAMAQHFDDAIRVMFGKQTKISRQTSKVMA